MKQFYFVSLIICLLSLSLGLSANENRSVENFVLNGQEYYDFELTNTENVTRYREEEVDSTCTRQIPYIENQCGYETNYRNECRTENEYVCRNVRRTRTECSGGRTTTECRNVNGRRICRQVPGRRVCREVPYYDRVCNYERRRVCSNVPYQEYICRDVTLYRTEEYPCRRTIQVPYQVRVKRIAKINFDFVGNNLQTNIEFIVKFKKDGVIKVKAVDNSSVRYLILIKKNLDDVRESDNEVNYNINYKVKLLKAKRVFSPIRKEASELVLYKKRLEFNLGKIFKESLFSIRVKIVKENGKVKLDRVFNFDELSVSGTTEGKDRLSFDLKALGVKISKRKEYDITIVPKINLDRVDFEIININDFDTESLFSGRFSVTRD